MHDILVQIIEKHYAGARVIHHSEEHRRIVLRVLHENWPASNPNLESSNQDVDGLVLYEGDQDLFQHILEDEAPGILIRTDYSNEDAWDAFRAKLQDAEKDVIESLTESSAGNDPEPEPEASGGDDVSMDDGSESDSTSSNTPITSILKVLDGSSPEERALLNNISNLSALRLLNGVDLRLAPTPLPGTNRVLSANPLVDKNGWQEVYRGKNIWIYDLQSNQDECARVVSQLGDIYGTATGDSWRARVSHIPELQFSMTFLGMKIDFGGLDKWDFNERERNLREAIIA